MTTSGYYLGTILCVLFIAIIVFVVIWKIYKKCNVLINVDKKNINVSNPSGPNEQIIEDRCVSCLSPVKYPLQACCSHIICTQCMINLHESKLDSPVLCPKCNREILIKGFFIKSFC